MLNNSLSPRLLKKVQMQGGTPEAGYPVRWVQAYWRYVAASAEAGGAPSRRLGHRRWVFFSGLLGRRGDPRRRLLRLALG